MAKLSTTIEDYLLFIHVLERDDKPIVGAHLAEMLRVSPPTVTNTLKRMARDGLIVMGKKGARLSKSGRESARTVMRRHMLTEWMMTRMLPWSKVHNEAHNLEHAISAEVEAALYEEFGHPQTCPHGNPLPGCEGFVAGWVPLTSLSPNGKATIRRIHELAEHDAELMAFLEDKGIVPGAQTLVREVLPFNQTITLEANGKSATLGFAAAKYIYAETGKE